MSVTLQEFKDHQKLEHHDEDDLLDIYRLAALGWVETQTGHKLSRKSRISHFDSFGDMELLGESPSDIVVNYIDHNGSDQVLSSDIYSLKTHKARPYLTLSVGSSWPSTSCEDAPIKVTYLSGYDELTLPFELKASVLIVAGGLYEFRESEITTRIYENKSLERLMSPYKIFKF